MKATRIAVVQAGWTGDRPSMIAQISALVEEAAAKNASIIALQEFTFSPYFASEMNDDNYTWAEPLRGGETDRVLSKLAQTHNVTLLGSIFERDENGTHWDTATVHAPSGELSGFTRKVHIPEGAGYHEDYYYGGSDQFPVHDADGLNIAVPTCYDQWFPEMSRICALNGAELIHYPTAIGSEPEFPDLDTSTAWQTVMRGQAIANGVYITAANRIGAEDVTFYGRSFICNPMGDIIAEASRDKAEVIVADLDPDLFEQWRYLFPLLKQRRPGVYSALTNNVP